jgi:flagellar biosynthesis protein FlhB
VAEESGQEKTEEPTEKRRQDTRDKGQVPRSRELNTVISLMVSALGIMWLGEMLVNYLATQMSTLLTIDRADMFDPASVMAASSDALINTFTALAPLLTIAMLSAFFGPVVMGGWIFKFTSMAPKFEKLDPVKGLAKIFSSQGLMELLKALGKFFLVSSVSAVAIYFSIREILFVGLQPLELSLVHTGSLITYMFLVVSSVLILVALVDVPFQLFQFNQKIRMTKQEVKDELKETDGIPEVKSRIRSLQQQVSRRRMMEAVPDADVVITNPIHFAVALRYSDDSALAPVVVARGRDLVALHIIEIARENDVLVFQAPPLARALYASTDLQQEIPANLYVAVAQVLAYVYQLRNMDPGESTLVELPDISLPDDYGDTTYGN